MAIDNIAQLVTTQVRSGTGPGVPAATPAAPVRQELPAEAKPEATPEPREVAEAVSRIQGYVQTLRRDLQFRVDENLNRVVVTVVDSDSGEVIRQIPGEEVIAVARSLEQMQQGLLVNQQA
jgi:flagellar protein FlaG